MFYNKPAKKLFNNFIGQLPRLTRDMSMENDEKEENAA